MPSRTRRRRRKPRRKPRSGRRSVSRVFSRPTVSYMPARVVSDSVMVKLNYGFSRPLNNGTNTMSITMRGSDIFLPNPDVPSQQPIGFDEWKTIFLRFEVLASSCKTRVINIQEASPIQWCVYPTWDFQSRSFNTACAQPYAKRAFSDTLGSGSAQSRVNAYASTHKLLGRAPLGDSYTAIISGSPSKFWIWRFEFENPELSQVLDFEIQQDITYYVRFYERQALGN